jgi:hypothetical protein
MWTLNTERRAAPGSVGSSHNKRHFIPFLRLAVEPLKCYCMLKLYTFWEAETDQRNSTKQKALQHWVLITSVSFVNGRPIHLPNSYINLCCYILRIAQLTNGLPEYAEVHDVCNEIPSLWRRFTK